MKDKLVFEIVNILTQKEIDWITLEKKFKELENANRTKISNSS